MRGPSTAIRPVSGEDRQDACPTTMDCEWSGILASASGPRYNPAQSALSRRRPHRGGFRGSGPRNQSAVGGQTLFSVFVREVRRATQRIGPGNSIPNAIAMGQWMPRPDSSINRKQGLTPAHLCNAAVHPVRSPIMDRWGQQGRFERFCRPKHWLDRPLWSG